MLEVLNSIVVGFFGVAIFVCAVFGSSRGQRVRRVNAHVVFFYLWHMVLLYLVSIWVDFTEAAWPRDTGPVDIHVGRFIKSFFVIITFTLLATYRMKEDALDLGLHAFICVTTSLMLYMSARSFHENARAAWLAAAISTLVLLILHILKEGMHPRVRYPALIRFLAFFVVSYIIFYLFATITSPYHQNLISFRVYEILMTIADIIITVFCSIPIVHFSWALTTPVRPTIFPGFVNHLRKDYETHEISRFFHQYS